MVARHLAAHKKGARVCMGARWVGCHPRWRNERRAAQHIRRRILRAESSMRNLLGWRPGGAPGGWDATCNGVMKGVQHNTYDVEFYGPNPLCGIYYLGALRASAAMARAVGDTSSAQQYLRLADQGQHWIDANLFNGEYYIQKVTGFKKDDIAPNLRGDMGAENTESPEYQVGGGCLADQLIGQYLADVGSEERRG